MCHTNGYVADGVDVDGSDNADAADGVVETVNVTAVVGHVDVDDAGT